MMATEQGFKVCRLRDVSGGGEATIVPELGGIVSSLRLPWAGESREVLFRHPHFWDPGAERTRGGIPFLFPVCGRMQRDGASGVYIVGGRVYAMKIHGFSMRGPWQTIRADETAVTVALADSAESRTQYPFAFRLNLTFRFEQGAFLIDQTYENTGKVPLPYYAGFHPYFLTPDPGAGKDSVILDYAPVARWAYNATLTDIAGKVAAPALPTRITDPAINEALTEVGADREVRLRYPDGVVLHTRADGVEDPAMFRFVQLYTMDDRPFFCVEPWMGFPNGMNTVDGVRWLAAGAVEHGCLRVWTSRA